LNIRDDDVENTVDRKKMDIMIEKNRMMHMNALWKKQHEQSKRRYVNVALLGPRQSFGDEEIINNQPTRHNRAVVKSYSAEIFIIPAVKFIENAPDPSSFFQNLKKNIKKSWRDTFANQLVVTSEKNQIMSKMTTLDILQEQQKDKENATVAPVFIPIANMKGVKKIEIKHFRTASLSNIYTTPLPDSIQNSINLSNVRGVVYRPLGEETPHTHRQAKDENSPFPQSKSDGPENLAASQLSVNRTNRLQSASTNFKLSEPKRSSSVVNLHQSNNLLPRSLAVSQELIKIGDNFHKKTISQSQVNSPTSRSTSRSKLSGGDRLWVSNLKRYSKLPLSIIKKYGPAIEKKPSQQLHSNTNSIISSIPNSLPGSLPGSLPQSLQGSPRGLAQSQFISSKMLNSMLKDSERKDQLLMLLEREKDILEKQTLIKKLGVDKLFEQPLKKIQNSENPVNYKILARKKSLQQDENDIAFYKPQLTAYNNEKNFMPIRPPPVTGLQAENKGMLKLARKRSEGNLFQENSLNLTGRSLLKASNSSRTLRKK